MSTAASILSFTFTKNELHLDARAVERIRLKMHAAIENLEVLAKKLGDNNFSFKELNDIPKIYRRFKKSIAENRLEQEFSKRSDLRKLTFSLQFSENELQTIFDNKSELSLLFDFLNKRWSNEYLYGLMDCMMSNWETENFNSLELLRSFICRKVQEYGGERKTLVSLKNHLIYFKRSDGPELLGKDLARLNISLGQITKYMALPDGWIRHIYFSKAIFAYCCRKKLEIAAFIHELRDILTKHNCTLTNQRVISELILIGEQINDVRVQDEIKLLAFQKLGDPASVSQWIPHTGTTSDEVSRIRKAKEVLNVWITRQFITVFFNTCLNEPRRQKFWLKHTQKIRSFKVVGSNYTKQLLKRDKRIAEYVDARYHVVHSSSSIAAILMEVGDYCLIEFSDRTYAFYAYKNSNILAPKLDGKYYSVDSLRASSMGHLIYRQGTNITFTRAEGRMPHNDGDLNWEFVFEYWIDKYLG